MIPINVSLEERTRLVLQQLNEPVPSQHVNVMDRDFTIILEALQAAKAEGLAQQES